MSAEPATPRRAADPLLHDEGHVESLLGNEAIVRGAIEAGVGFVSGYPGTPSSEVTDSFARLARQVGVVFEYSVNEKVALEMAYAASLAGARALCAMKHLGLMYAGDPLSTIPYVGVGGGLVIVSAGDPSCRTSPNEQDQRHLGPMLHLPILDPATPREAHAMARFAFDLSEESRLPVLLRPTTRVCHSRMNITYGPRRAARATGFVPDPPSYNPIPINARRMRLDLPRRLERAREILARSDFLRREGNGSRVVLASGAPAGAVADRIRELDLGDQVRLVTVGAVFPLPEERLLELLEAASQVLVVEELSPYLEDALRSLLARRDRPLPVLGKRTGHLPEAFEYDPAVLDRALHALGVAPEPRPVIAPLEVPPRPPSLCPGCPHRASYLAARFAFDEEQLYFNDIGCYTLGYGNPLGTSDALLCMGAGFTLAAGVSRVTGQRTVGFLGDSTFFHSGMPALLNAIKEDVSMVAVILDNQVTAMTGFQESPFVATRDQRLERRVDIAAICRALGARQVETVDPYDLPQTVAAFERARDGAGVSVIITERPCPAFQAKATRSAYKLGTYEIDPDRCRICGREADGQRCAETVSLPFERQLARRHALTRSAAIAPALPAATVDRPASAPCSRACPLGLCIQGLIGHITAGEYREAWQKIVSQISLPDSVCRVCHRPCEAACVRNDLDEPLAVNDLKRFVMEWAATQGLGYEPEREAPSGRRVVVVGAGPAGLAAAHDLVLRGHAVTLIDAAKEPGGLLRTGIPDYRLPPAALDRDVQRILGLGIDFQGGRRLGRDVTLRELLDGYDAVCLAVGAPLGLDLRLPGARTAGAPPVHDALGYLAAASRGQAPELGDRVLVVGGGNAAVDAARTARRLGAGRVTMVYRRRREEMPAFAEEIAAAKAEGVILLTQRQPARLEAGCLVTVCTEPGDPDPSGRRRPVPVPGSEEPLEAEAILAAIGQAPDPSLFGAGDPGPDQAADQTIQVDALTFATANPKLFAVGDVTGLSRTVTEAMAAGRRAAWAIDRLLRGPERADRRAAPPPPVRDPPRPAGLDAPRAARQQPTRRAPAERTASFAEVTATLTVDQARAEAARCLACGLCGNCRSCIDLLGCPAFYVTDDRIHIDPQLCMGCGVCAVICPNGAIRRVAEEDA